MKLGTSNIAKEIDSYAINNIGIPSIVLMENAAIKILEHVKHYNKIVIVCGVGNNGGDGLALARQLHSLNKDFKVYIVGNIEKMTKDAKINFNICKNMNLNINILVDDCGDLITSVKESNIVIDCIFGIGLNRAVNDFVGNIIDILNHNSKYILSVDVPSGFNCDNGKPNEKSIKANKTITFFLNKIGFLNYQSENYTGEVQVEDIGIPENMIDEFTVNDYLITKESVSKILMKRDIYGHKGTFGHTVIFGGSKGYEGAACMCGEGALKSGSGLTTLCVNSDVLDIIKTKMKEVMTFGNNDHFGITKLVSKAKSIVVGVGMGNTINTFDILKKILDESNVPIVIDADGINVLKDNLHILKCNEGKYKIVLTPHPGEFARLIGRTNQEVNENRMELAREFAKLHDVILVLKGYRTIITDGEKLYVNSSGNSAMATGGMGDVLSGIIASFISQGYEPISATCLGVYIHGLVGDILSKDMYVVTPTDVTNELPRVICELIKNKTN